MKTNITMQSADRNLFGVIIRQNTKDGQSLSVSDLQKAYNIARYQNGWSERRIERIMTTKDFQERCYHLLNERGIIKAQISAFTEMVENESIVKVLKGLGVWKTSGRAENKSTYCDPYIWVLLAMELNPLIYAKVVIWLTDKLIINRVIAGTEFLPMNRAISKIVPQPDFSLYSRLINGKIFGKHEKGIRDTANQIQLSHLLELERSIIQMIDMNIIKSESQLIKFIELYKIREIGS